ncbi:MAG: glycosyltransferase family 1 protein [Endomicrobiaceae bacterium]|nr:glycosyltransferase family 1 protein [Endomicrobiaceae bacterium]
MTKKILEMTGSLNCAGIETLLVNVLKNIDRDKFKIDFLVVANQKYFYTDEVLKFGSKIYTYPFKKVYKFLIPFFFLKEIFVLLKNKYDVVHCHFYFSSGIILLLAWLCGVKTRIVHSHTERKMFAPKILRKPFTKIMQKIIDIFATDKIACSKEAGIALYGDNANFKIVNNGVVVDKFKFDSQIRQKTRENFNLGDSFVLGHIGRFVELKNHSFLVDIFNEILKYKKNSVLLFIGEGPLEEEIKEKVNNLKLEKQVKFLGVRSDINNIYQAMDVFLLPSLFEGLPIVGIEAQTAGLPCFFSDKISKEVKIVNSHFISLKENSEFWAKKIIDICENFERTDTSEEIIKSGYGFVSTITAFENLYV